MENIIRKIAIISTILIASITAKAQVVECYNMIGEPESSFTGMTKMNDTCYALYSQSEEIIFIFRLNKIHYCDGAVIYPGSNDSYTKLVMDLTRNTVYDEKEKSYQRVNEKDIKLAGEFIETESGQRYLSIYIEN